MLLVVLGTVGKGIPLPGRPLQQLAVTLARRRGGGRGRVFVGRGRTIPAHADSQPKLGRRESPQKMSENLCMLMKGASRITSAVFPRNIVYMTKE